MKRYFRVMYIDGYDEIEVTSEDVLDQKRVKTALNQLLGFEAIEFTPHKVIVRNIATPNADQFDNIFRRLFLIVLNYGRTTLEIMQKGNYEQALELQDMEPTINKFCFFCERVLMKHDIHSRQKTLHWYSFAGAIEQIADFSGYLCETLIRQKKPLSKTILTAATNVTKILEEIYKVFYDFNIETLTQLRKTRRSQILVLMELFHKKLSPAETEILSSLLLMMNALKEMEIEMVSLYAKPDK